MNLTTEAKILKHVIEITNKDTNKKEFLYKNDNDEWEKISEKEYNNIILGDTNGK